MPTLCCTSRVLGVVVLLAATLPALSQVDVFEPPAPLLDAESTIGTPELWFVELASPPSVEGTPAATLAAEKNAFRASARAAGLRYSERMAFGTLWNGFSVRVDPGDLDKLRRLPGVAAIYPITSIPIPTTETVYDPELLTALNLTGADIAQSSLGLSGAGVRVGIIDTGLDYDHPDLGGSGVNGGTSFPTNRVVAGYDFVGDAYTGTNTPQPDANPDDCMGHGTHVAGIIGANGIVKGVAPGVVFGAYRIGGCSGAFTGDIVIAAMERALTDGMQVVNMSIGSAAAWPQSPEAKAANRLVNQGVVVVASLGNQGSWGLYSAASPAIGEKVIGVASFDNSYLNHIPAFSLSPDNRLVGYFAASGAPASPLSGTFPLARTGLPTSPNDACIALAPASLLGKVALISPFGCTYYTKAKNAQAAGAAGVLIYGSSLSISVTGSPAISIPVVAVSSSDGVTINNRIAAGVASMTWTNEFTSVPAPSGGLISSYSSWGLTADLDLKPDIGAPGGYIYSTYPLERGGYTAISGTSMSSPHVAGAVALLLEAKPRTPALAVRDILQNSALPKPFWGKPAMGLDNVHRQGAGMLQIDKAILATTRVSPAKLPLGESQAGAVTRSLTVRNESSTERTYTLAHTPALATGPSTFSVVYGSAPATLAYSQYGIPISELSVPAGGAATLDVTITAPIAPNRVLYGGYVVIVAQGDGETVRVPYAGFIGDYQSIQALAPTSNGYPWLLQQVRGIFQNRPSGATYTMAGGDIPYIGIHLDHQVRTLRMEIFDAYSGKAWHRALELNYFRRDQTATSGTALPWDGTTINGNQARPVPNGQYVIRLSVLKALGDDSNPADWETWTSPVITIARQ